MARTKNTARKAPKDIVSQLEDKKRKNREKNAAVRHKAGLNFRTYIHRVFQVASPRKGPTDKMRPIGMKAMTVLNDMCVSILEKICARAHALMQNTKTVMFSDNDLNAIFRLIFKGDLGKNAVYESLRANACYDKAMEESKKKKKETTKAKAN